MGNVKIILNERTWCEDILDKLDMGDNAGETLQRLARYYHYRGLSRKDVARRLEEFIIRCNPHDSLVSWQQIVDRCVRRAGKRKLIEVDGVSVTKNEMNVIRGADGRIKQRLLFTMLCLAKFANAANPQNHNWVNKSVKDIFQLANIKIAYERQLLTMNAFYTMGLVDISKGAGTCNLKLPWIEESGEEEWFVDDFRNLGNQYMKYMGEDYIECEICGVVVKRHSNRQIYCTDCAAREHRERMLLKYYSENSDDLVSALIQVHDNCAHDFDNI